MVPLVAPSLCEPLPATETGMNQQSNINNLPEHTICDAEIQKVRNPLQTGDFSDSDKVRALFKIII